ncbi:hypothetical protein PspLS_07749 [Pyricularia sp. CBS 133598]|nr:hypothetical protein PspLS_07749 [Pyricularia sp. CBS 133598]
MREILGMPIGVSGACLTPPGIFCVLFDYGHFGVTYESDLSSVPDFDAHIEVYSADRIVRVEFNSPYVKEGKEVKTSAADARKDVELF